MIDASSLLLSESFKTFKLFVETKSTAKTAQILNLSVSAVTRQLSNFEKVLSVELLDRSVKPMRPTPEAIQFVDRISKQILPLNSLIEDMIERNGRQMSLRIGFLESLSIHVAPEVIANLKRDFSSVLCLTGASDRLIEKLQQNRLDFAVVSNSYSSLDNLRRHFIFSEPNIVLLPKSVLNKRNILTWKDLQFCGIPYIHYYQESSGKLATNFLSSIGIEPPEQIEVDTTGPIMGLIQRSMGWTITRTSSLMPHQELLDWVSAIPAPEPVMQREVYLFASNRVPLFLYERVVEEVLKACQGALLPNMLAIAPWIAGKVRLGEKSRPRRPV